MQCHTLLPAQRKRIIQGQMLMLASSAYWLAFQCWLTALAVAAADQLFDWPAFASLAVGGLRLTALPNRTSVYMSMCGACVRVHVDECVVSFKPENVVTEVNQLRVAGKDDASACI